MPIKGKRKPTITIRQQYRKTTMRFLVSRGDLIAWRVVAHQSPLGYYAKGGYTTSTSGSPTSTSTSSTSAGQSPATSSASPSSTPNPRPASPSLSTGGKAGIGVGAALGALILAALIAVVILLRRRTHENKSNQAREAGLATPAYATPFVFGDQAPKGEWIAEVESARPEMAAQDPSYRRGELPANPSRSEMEGSYNVYR
ncbi:MAG: hypothetical protein Q9168_007976 [Polycauliona sp. 1 TL-2023]